MSASTAAKVNPFRRILELSAGDFIAKLLNFLAFVYLARVLGVASFGTLELANSVLLYFLLLADAGLEGWGVREIARREDVRDVAGPVTALRLLLASASFGVLLVIRPLLPPSPQLSQVVILLGVSLFPQAVNLKWIFMGQQKMTMVAGGLVVGQVLFAGAVFAFVHSPDRLLWVPIFKLGSDSAMAAYFAWRFVADHGSLRLPLQLRRAARIVAPAATMGASSALSMVNYNFDSLMLGFVTGAAAVGWYSAAYKVVTAALAMPLTYFFGLYPALAGSYARSQEEFRVMMAHSVRLAAAFAIPLGVGGTMLAGPIVLLLFGSSYAPSIPVLRLLIWSAVLVILRGTFRHGLTVANRAGVELRCAMVSAGTNIALNLVLIPRNGMMGAAAATLISELVWVSLVANRLSVYVVQLRLLPYLWAPALAGGAMAACLWFGEPIFWIARAALALAVYGVVLILASGTDPRGWRELLKRPAL